MGALARLVSTVLIALGPQLHRAFCTPALNTAWWLSDGGCCERQIPKSLLPRVIQGPRLLESLLILTCVYWQMGKETAWRIHTHFF